MINDYIYNEYVSSYIHTVYSTTTTTTPYIHI